MAVHLVAHKEIDTVGVVRYGLYDAARRRVGELVFDPVTGSIVHEDDDRPVVGFVWIAAKLIKVHRETGCTPELITHVA